MNHLSYLFLLKTGANTLRTKLIKTKILYSNKNIKKLLFFIFAKQYINNKKQRNIHTIHAHTEARTLKRAH